MNLAVNLSIQKLGQRVTIPSLLFLLFPFIFSLAFAFLAGNTHHLLLPLRLFPGLLLLLQDVLGLFRHLHPLLPGHVQLPGDLLPLVELDEVHDDDEVGVAGDHEAEDEDEAGRELQPVVLDLAVLVALVPVVVEDDALDDDEDAVLGDVGHQEALEPAFPHGHQRQGHDEEETDEGCPGADGSFNDCV